MNTHTKKTSPVSHHCDFCKTPGLLNQTLFNHAGWYYCQNCLSELNERTAHLRNQEHQPSLFPAHLR